MRLILVLMFAGSLARAGQTPNALTPYFERHAVKRKIVKSPRGLLRHEYVVPGGPYFQLFDWDMYFMGVAVSYDKVWRPIVGSVEDFLAFVDEFGNWPGYTPREIAPDTPWALPEMCKPFLAQAAVRASLTSGDFRWLLGSDPPPATGERRDPPRRATFYAKLKDTLAFWENNRRAPDGLFVWYNGVESGIDNSPAVSDVPAQTTEGVDLQCYVYREYSSLALIAERLGETRDAELYRAKAAGLKALVGERLWSEQDGMYWNRDSRSGAPIKVKAWTSFVPLWAGIATRPQAKRMIEEHLLDPAQFWSPHGVRTLAADERLYDPRRGYWRGPVWVVSNYLVMHGLLNYGYEKQAAELADATERLLVADFEKSGGMNENYDPETGAPAAKGNFVSWNLLAEHMKEEAVSGRDPTAIPELTSGSATKGPTPGVP